MALTIYALGHSGFLVDTGKTVVVFDCYFASQQDPLALAGVALEDFLDRTIVVFSSHSHYDHYSPQILTWQQKRSDITYVLSDDINVPDSLENVVSLAPHQSTTVGELKVMTLRSTDLGVAFIVEVDGYRLYHAGDLNWWHWDSYRPSVASTMELDYKGEIDQLAASGKIDVAFVPVDPRLGKAMLFGIDYLMQNAQVDYAVPMHFAYPHRVFSKLEQCCYQDHIVVYDGVGKIKTLP